MNTTFSSLEYWNARYRAGGTSGAGSYGRLATYKAAVINGIIEMNDITRIADFGCGDGNLLSMLRPTAYTGLDVSEIVMAACRVRFPQHIFLPFSQAADVPPADMCLSVDVIFHLTEQSVFASYMQELFSHATRLVLIYSSNMDLDWPAPHVRHRRFTSHIADHFPGWRLCAHLPNPYPFNPACPHETSFADFFIYTSANSGCRLPLPAVEFSAPDL